MWFFLDFFPLLSIKPHTSSREDDDQPVSLKGRLLSCDLWWFAVERIGGMNPRIVEWERVKEVVPGKTRQRQGLEGCLTQEYETMDQVSPSRLQQAAGQRRGSSSGYEEWMKGGSMVTSSDRGICH